MSYYRDAKGRFAKKINKVDFIREDKPLDVFNAVYEGEKAEKSRKEFFNDYTKETLSFLKLEPNTQYPIKILGEPLPFKKHFLGTDGPAQRYLVNVLDKTDGKVKVMQCGKLLMNELRTAALQKPVETKSTLLSTIIKWFKKNILRKKEEKFPKTDTMDFVVEKWCAEWNPRVFKYDVRRDCAIR